MHIPDAQLLKYIYIYIYINIYIYIYIYIYIQCNPFKLFWSQSVTYKRATLYI